MKKRGIHIKKETCITYKQDLFPIQTHQTPMFCCKQSQTNRKRRTHFKKHLQKNSTSYLYTSDTNDSLSATSKETYTYQKIQSQKRPSYYQHIRHQWFDLSNRKRVKRDVMFPKRDIQQRSTDYLYTSDTQTRSEQPQTSQERCIHFRKRPAKTDLLTIRTHHTLKLALSNRKQVERDEYISKETCQKVHHLVVWHDSIIHVTWLIQKMFWVTSKACGCVREI